MVFPKGSIHGRFQPFHKGHARYLLEAMKNCEHLIVGITQYDIQKLIDSPCDTHRAEKANNPLTFEQRCDIISAFLEGEGIARERYSFMPFPIDEPDKLPDFVSTDVVCFTTSHSIWNQEKARRLTVAGYKVVVLMNPDQTTTNKLSATQVRDMIRAGDENWRLLVPRECVARIVTSGAYDRIKES